MYWFSAYFALLARLPTLPPGTLPQLVNAVAGEKRGVPMASGEIPVQSGATSLVVFLRTASGLPSPRWMLQEAAYHLL